MNYEIFTDKHSNFKFCFKQSEFLDIMKKDGIYDYPLIDWCKQFLKKDGLFLDIGSHIGTYSIILSQYCKQVYAFECSQEILTYLKLSIQTNQIENITVIPKVLDDKTETLDNLNLTNINFMKIYAEGYELEILKGAENTLKNNNYPSFIFEMKENNKLLMDYIKYLNYSILPIVGATNMYLACDNTIRKNTIYKNMMEELNSCSITSERLNELLDYFSFEAFRQKNYEFGQECCELLALSDNTSDQLKNKALLNEYLYMKTLPYKEKVMLNIPMSCYRVPNNSSIITTDNGYLCNIRCSNYVYEPNFRFLENNIHISEHKLLTLDKNFNIIKTIELIDKTNNIYYDSFIKGIDDLRLINHEYFICSHGNFNNHRHIQQCLGKFDEKGNVNKLIPLIGPNLYRHEKNWLPFIKNDKFYVIYTIDPFILYYLDKNTGDLTLIKNEKLNENNYKNCKGSSPPIPYKNGWLATVHQTTSNLCYMQRFVWFDYQFTKMIVSLPFYFERQGIEFNLGMCHSENGLILTHSVLDNFSRLIIVNYDIVDQYLKL